MNFELHIEKEIKAFCDRLAPVEAAYDGHAVLGYCAVRDGETWVLYSAKLSLDHTSNKVPGRFRSDRVLAGRIPFNNRGLSSRRLIEKLLEALPIDGPSVALEPEQSGSYSVYLVPHHRIEGDRTALATLKLRGGRRWDFIDRQEIGWHLRGSELPYESLAELCSDFDAGDDPGGIEIVAAPVVRILPSSIAQQQQARVEIECATALAGGACRLSYRILEGATVRHRLAVTGAKLVWTEEGNRSIASHVIPIPEGAMVDCAVSYQDETHHQAWLVDRTSVQSIRRAAFEPSDADLEEMRTLLSIDSDKQHSKGFEAAVSWLLWMLGFSPAHLCLSGHHENGPDLLVECDGNLAVIECTLGQLKSDKRSKLGSRCVSIRESLVASRNRNVYVLPVMVTRSTSEQASADIREAANEGQHVLTRDDLLQLLERTRQPYSAAEIFGEWRHALEAARSVKQQ